MALPAGQITFTLEYAKDLKDQDFFGRMDPYAVVVCGGQRFRTKTHTDGGRNPVWNQSFQFNVINENTVEVELFDSDTMSRDDKIGSCTVDLSKARMQGVDHQQAAVRTHKGKQHGFVSVKVAFQGNGQPQQQQQQQHNGMPPAATQYPTAAPQWAPYAAPMPYPGPPAYPPQPAYYAPPAGYPMAGPPPPPPHAAAYYPPQQQQYYAAPAPIRFY